MRLFQFFLQKKTDLNYALNAGLYSICFKSEITHNFTVLNYFDNISDAFYYFTENRINQTRRYEIRQNDVYKISLVLATLFNKDDIYRE